MRLNVAVVALAVVLTGTGCSSSEKFSQEEIEQFDEFMSSIRVDGAEIDKSSADQWFANVYVESICPDVNDSTQDCEITELIGSRSVFVPEEFDLQIASIGVNEDGDVKWGVETYKAPQSMNLWCFKKRSFTRKNSELQGESILVEFEDFDYPCYLLTDAHGDGDLQATFFGSLLESGFPGVRPEDECRIEFGRNGKQDLPEKYDECVKEKAWTAPPSW